MAGGVDAGVDAVSAMLVRTCEYVDNRHTESAEAVLCDIADTPRAHRRAIFGVKHSTGGVVLGPEHAQLLAAAGYSRADVQQWLFEHAGRSQADLVAAGKESHDAGPRPRPVPDDAVGRGDPGDRRRRRQRRHLDGLPPVRLVHVVRPLGRPSHPRTTPTPTQEAPA